MLQSISPLRGFNFPKTKMDLNFKVVGGLSPALAISNELTPLDMNNLPATYSLPLSKITRNEIDVRLKKFKKPRSMVPGDVFPPTRLSILYLSLRALGGDL